MKVMVLKNQLHQAFVYSIKVSTKYIINFYSWIAADFALYSFTFLSYLLMSTTLNNYGYYNKSEMLLYLSCYYVVNNLISIFFAQGLDELSSDMWSGKFIYALVSPTPILRYYFLKNLNFSALVSTLPLIIINICCIYANNSAISILYIISIIIATCVLMLLFLLIFTLELWGIHSMAMPAVITQILDFAEKSDSIFNKNVRMFFTAIIPIFLLSAVPCRIALNKINNVDLLL